MAHYRSIILATAGLVAYYRLGEASGTVAADEGPNGLDGVYQNTPTLGEAGLLTDDDDTAVAFSGVIADAESVRIAHGTPFDITAAVTVEAWVNRDASLPDTYVTTVRGIYGLWSGTTPIFLGWLSGTAEPSSDDATFTIRIGAANKTLTATGVLTAGLHHVVGVYDGATQKLYVDGVEVGTRNQTGAIDTDSGDRAIAFDRSDRYFPGTVDELAIYDRALPLAEIKAHFDAGVLVHNRTLVHFVDKIDSKAKVLLDLNDGDLFRTLADVDMSPPPLRRSVAGTLLQDGSLIAASAYGNRILGLKLRVSAPTEANLAAHLTELHRELDKATNIIRFQRDSADPDPIFFRTFRSPDYKLDSRAPDPIAKVDVSIVAEPFAYGLRLQPAVDITVNNDPAAGGGIRFDVTGIVGDVPSPAVIVANGDSSLSIFYLATRRHGTPANFDEDHQCEAMTQETDTTTQPNNALYSGGGNNFSRTTFATASMATRLSATIPGGTNGPDKRGTYRVFLRYLMTGSADLIDVQMRLGGDTGPATDKVRLKSHGGNILSLADLGLIQIPAVDPKQIGYNSEDADVGNIVISFQAERVSGSGNLDWDYIVLMPADEEFSITDFIPALDGNIDSQIWDGPNDMVYIGVEALVTVGAGALDGKPRPPTRVGSLPLLSPNQTNRIYVLHTRAVDGRDMLLSTSHTFDVYYWPRFLYIR